MKLVRDNFNGGMYVWKYYESRNGFVNGWFDYGPHFYSKVFAKQWMENRT